MTATFTIVVKANANDVGGSNITNTAIVSTSTSDFDTTNNSATVITTVTAMADLSVTKTCRQR